MVTITVNGVRREIQAPNDTPLLYVLRNDLELSGPQFGCGLAQCGACSVLLDGKEIRSCITPLSAAAGKEVTTLEGLPARWAQQKGLSPGRRREDASPRSTGLDRGADASVRLLPERHDDQGDRTAGARRHADRRGNQRGVHDVGSVGASVPLRKLHRHHRSRAARCHGHGESEVSNGHPKRKTSQRFWRHSDAPSVRQSGRRAVRRLRRCRRRRLEEIRQGRQLQELRSTPRSPVRGSRFIPTTPS